MRDITTSDFVNQFDFAIAQVAFTTDGSSSAAEINKLVRSSALIAAFMHVIPQNEEAHKAFYHGLNIGLRSGLIIGADEKARAEAKEAIA